MEGRGKSAKQIFTDWAQESSIAGIEFNSKCWLEFCLNGTEMANNEELKYMILRRQIVRPLCAVLSCLLFQLL